MAHPPVPHPACQRAGDRPRPPPPLTVLLLAVLCLLAAPAHATEPVPGRSLASVRAWLLQHNPELRALELEADAAQARILPAGALPDPSAAITLRSATDAGGGQNPDMGREVGLTLRQPFPLWGKRGLARSVAREQAAASRLDRDATARDLLAEAEASYVLYWHAGQAVTVLDRRIALLRQIEEIAGIRYALGLAAQQDAIRAQVEQTTLQRERIERLAARDEATASLNTALGRPADAPLEAPATAPQLPLRPAATASLDDHPAVHAQSARVAAAHGAAELERRNRFPDLTLGIGTMRPTTGPARLELMLEVQLPLQQRARREREREARLLEQAAQVRVEAVRRTLDGRGTAARARWRGARERRRLTEQTLLPQADAAYQSALASYQVGAVDFGTLLEALAAWQGADLARLDALRDELLGAAAVRAIEGGNAP